VRIPEKGRYRDAITELLWEGRKRKLSKRLSEGGKSYRYRSCPKGDELSEVRFALKEKVNHIQGPEKGVLTQNSFEG